MKTIRTFHFILISLTVPADLPGQSGDLPIGARIEVDRRDAGSLTGRLLETRVDTVPRRRRRRSSRPCRFAHPSPSAGWE